MDNNQVKRISKFLSYVLRHHPESIGITLENEGWAEVKILLDKNKYKFTLRQLEYVVENNDKKRFEFNSDKTKIRARQGHSIQVNLNYEPQKPPEILYHGTSGNNLN